MQGGRAGCPGRKSAMKGAAEMNGYGEEVQEAERKGTRGGRAGRMFTKYGQRKERGEERKLYGQERKMKIKGDKRTGKEIR